MTKTDHFIFTAEDEAEFSSEITAVYPETVFIDDNFWATETPPARASIEDCRSKFVFIWNRAIYPKLPYGRRPDGRFEGPSSGMVIQFIRSRLKDDATLVSGEIAAGVTVDRPEVPEMLKFVRGVWRILKKTAPAQVVQVDPQTREVQFPRTDILVGEGAYEWCAEREERFLKFNNNILIHLRPFPAHQVR